MKPALIPLALLVGAAQAQPCLPNTDTAEWSGGNLVVRASESGGCAAYLCLPNTFDDAHKPVWVIRCGTRDEMPRAGGKLATILAAPDPLKSLQTLPQRSKVLPLTDPLIAPVFEQFKAGK